MFASYALWLNLSTRSGKSRPDLTSPKVEPRLHGKPQVQPLGVSVFSPRCFSFRHYFHVEKGKKCRWIVYERELGG